jgi:protein-tyrosine phosphatase
MPFTNGYHNRVIYIFDAMRVKILFVCYENICRSPMAEGIFTDLLFRHGKSHFFEVSSAGTVCYQSGSSPDNRAVRISERQGIDITAIRAQCIHDLDLQGFDWIFVMDRENYHDVMDVLGSESGVRVNLMTDFSAVTGGVEIPDPYYGSEKDFVQVFNELRRASEDIVMFLFDQYAVPGGTASDGRVSSALFSL